MSATLRSEIRGADNRSGSDAMSTTDALAAPEAHGYQVPRLLRSADVLLMGGRRYRGRVFLPAAAVSHDGPMRIDEWLEEPASFFPFLPDGEGRPVILNKDQVVVLTVPGAGDLDDAHVAPSVPRQLVQVECGPQHVTGEVVIDMPADHLRVLDLLNRAGSFLEVREDERRHFVRKSRITRVSERP
jgi:hypothetical protein